MTQQYPQYQQQLNQLPTRPQNFVPNFETWDLRRNERTSCSTTEFEARSGCLSDRGRLLTIYTGDGLLVASYRDGKELTDVSALDSWSE